MRYLLLGAAAVMTFSAHADDHQNDNFLNRPVIEAMGRAYIQVPPNEARFSVVFEAKSETSSEASRLVIQRANAVTEAIREASGGDAQISANFSVRPYYEQVTETTRQGNDNVIERLVENRYPDALLGYTANVDVRVVKTAVDRVDITRGAGLAANPIASSPVTFHLKPDVASQQAAYRAALNDAASRAHASAEAMGTELGELLLVREGYGSCGGQITTPVGSAGQFRPPPPPMAPPPPPSRSIPQGLEGNPDDFKLAADPNPRDVNAQVCAIYAVR